MHWLCLVVELLDDECGWCEHENPAWIRYRLRAFRRSGGLGSLERVRVRGGGKVRRRDVDWTGLDAMLAADAPEIARIIAANAALIEKATLVTADLGDTGRLLNEAQTKRFLDIVAGKVPK